MRILFALSSFLCLTVGLNAQIGMGQWRMHVPASEAIDLAVGNGYVMAALTSGVLEYDVAASENRILNNLNALSDIQVSCISYEPQSKSFFVGYENGNLDQITPDGVINIPAIKLSEITGNKRVNKIIVKNGLAYAATGFAIVILDPIKNEVKDTYYPPNSAEGINDVAFLNDSIYALSDTKLCRGKITNAFLSDPLQWTTDVRPPVPVAARYSELAVQQNELHISYIMNTLGDSIFKLTNSGLEMVIGTQFSNMDIKRFHVENDVFYTYYTTAMIAFNDDLSVNFGVEYYGSKAAFPGKVLTDNGTIWVADQNSGLVRYQSPISYTFIQQEGPPKTRFFSVNGAKGKMIVTSGRIDRVVQSYFAPAAYAFEDESWKLFDNTNQTIWPSYQLWDMGVAAVNSKDLNEIAIGGYCKDALSIMNDGSQVSTVYTTANSPLDVTSVGNGNVCLSGLEYDPDGNLWMVNCYTNEPLKVRLADGTWQQFDTGTDSKNVFTGKLAIDYNGNKWFGIYGKGMVGFNDNETPSNTADDTYKILETGEGVGNLPSENVTAIAVDLDNEIWIGTDNGFAVLYNSDGIFSGSGTYDASRILITYEGNVENLLGSTPITDIEIDGGNRKWIGTASTGIFLLSADGQEVLAQYTQDNSPLISDNIMDMEFNHITGELFIITDQGLVSFRTDASQDDETYATTTVFPNPVKPDYFGPITIQGIRYDSDVKITDVAGNLVYKTTSNGGTATWNGKTLTGEDVASGVYLIWTATNTGKSRKVGKVAVIR